MAGKTVRLRGVDQIDNAPEEKARGITINISHNEYAPMPPLCAHRCSGHADYIKNMITVPLKWTALFCGCRYGWSMPQTANTFSWPNKLCAKIIVFLNKCDMVDDKDMIDMVEEEFASF